MVTGTEWIESRKPGRHFPGSQGFPETRQLLDV